MKKLILLILCMIIVPLSYAQRVQIGDLYYNLNDSNNTAEVTYEIWRNSNYESLSGELSIPMSVEYDGKTYSVTSIGDDAFYGCSGLTSVEIPNSVTSTGSSAFQGCSGLTSVTIPNSVTSIGKNAFENCYSLTSVEIPNSVTSIEDRVFRGCSGLASVEIPNSVTSIGMYAFWECSGLTSVEIPNSVTSIGDYAFLDCSGLTSVTLSGAITSLPFWCFARCFKLDTLIIPQESNITSEDRAFVDGGTITDFVILISDMDQYILEGCPTPVNLSNLAPGNVKPNSMQYLYKGSPIKNLTIPVGVEKIADYAFFKSDVLESVAFPDGFKEIGKAAFKDCQNLYNLQLPSTLTTLGDEAFAGCLSIYEINLPSTLASMGTGCFKGCQDLEKITLIEGMTAIGDNTFNGCTRLQYVPFPNSITSIGDNAFYGCTGLQKVVFPENLESIGAGAFSGGVRIQDFKLPKSIAAIGARAFSGTLDVTNLKLPEGLESVGSEAFLNCGIKTLTLPESLVFIGDRAFAGNSFTEVTIPASMTEITYGAFNGCANLNAVNFHGSVTSIGDYSFAGTAIRSLDIPAPVASIGSHAFGNSGIISVTFPETLATIGDNAFADTQMLSFEIPNSVTSIGQNAFGNLHYLKMGTGFDDFTVHFCSGTDVLEMVSATPPSLPIDRLGFTPNMVLVPEGTGPAYLANNRWKDYNIVARNANKAVVYLSESGTLATEIRLQTGLMPGVVTNLTVEGAALNEADFAVIRSNMPACYEIDMSGTANTAISSEVFKGKAGLLSISLPRRLKEIGDNAFENCYTAKFTVPETVETIGSNAFANCERMENDLAFGTSLKTIGENAFYGCRSLKGADFSSLDDVNWGSGVFANCYSLKSVSLPQKVTTIPSGMFANSGLEKIFIPATATIGYNAFDQCLSLMEVEFEDGFKTLDSSLFKGCTALANVIIPESVISIGSQTFYGCTALQDIRLPEGLEELGNGAFGNSGLTGVILPDAIQTIPESCFEGSSLVYVDMNGAKIIARNAFSGCPNLLVINLPNTIQSVDEGSLNSSNISAINSPTAKPAETAGNPFEKVDNAACALSIPKPSFTQYLSAEYWGKFVGIRNSIDISMENKNSEGEIEDDTDDPAVELTYMDEEDYQEMLEDMEQEKEENGDQPQENRRKALRIMRANSIADVNRGYGKLFNRASLFLDENASTRFFLALADDVTDFTVKYNGKDITKEVDLITMSFVIKGLYSMSSLVITTNGHTVEAGNTTVVTIGMEEVSDNAPYYNLNGQIVKNPTPGIYIHKGKKVIIK